MSQLTILFYSKTPCFLEDAFIRYSRFGMSSMETRSFGRLELPDEIHSDVFATFQTIDYSDFPTQTGHLFQEFGGWLKHHS